MISPGFLFWAKAEEEEEEDDDGERRIGKFAESPFVI